MFFIHKFEVPFGQVGYYFWDHKLQKTYEPGSYSLFGFGQNKGIFVSLNMISYFNMLNDSALSKDLITLKYRIYYGYKIIDIEKIFSHCMIYEEYSKKYNVRNLELDINNQIRKFLNDFFSQYNALNLSEDKELTKNIDITKLNQALSDFGFEITDFSISELTFPKKILDLFTKRLEANMRAVVDLENARTVIATARAMKNAASMLQDNDGTKFLYYLETMNKIATSGGKHTFHFSQNATKE